MSPPRTGWGHEVSVHRCWSLRGSLQQHQEPGARPIPSSSCVGQWSWAVMEEHEHNWAKHSPWDAIFRCLFTHHWNAVDYFAVGWCASSAGLQNVRRGGVAEEGFGKDWACNEQKWSTLWICVSICKMMKAYWPASLVDLFGTAAKLSSA